jgi:hypothetical protein
MPMVTSLPFFPPFFIANFCLFCQKGKSSVLTALPFCLFVFVSILFLLCWESLSFLWIWRQYIFSLYIRISHLDHHVPPPPPLCPRRWWYAWPIQSTWQQIISCRCRTARCRNATIAATSWRRVANAATSCCHCAPPPQLTSLPPPPLQGTSWACCPHRYH